MEFIHAIRRPTSPPGDYYDSGRLKVRIYKGKHLGSEHKLQFDKVKCPDTG